jgi:processive 1,2-diacylglycerol beta-glucosyltransferase
MPRLLVLSAGAGAGHNRAAEAVREHAKEAGVDAEWFDSLTFTGRVFRTLYAESYIWMASHSPALWGMLYKLMGSRHEQPNLRKLMKPYDSLNYRRLMRHIEQFRPDAIISTHFLPTNVVLAHLGTSGPPVFTVITDFDVHSIWIAEGVAGYFAGNEQVGWLCEKFGTPRERVHVTGIPVHPAFSRTRGRDAVRRELSLTSNDPVALFMSGGFGMGNMEEALERLLALPTPFQLLVVAGKNEKMKSRLEKIARGSKRPARVYGFVPNVHDFMEASDLVISKAGAHLGSASPVAAPRRLLAIGREAQRGLPDGRGAPSSRHDGPARVPRRELMDDPPRLARMRPPPARSRPFANRDIVTRVVEYLKR